MTFAKFKVEDNAQGQLLVGISSVVGTLTLKAWEGLKFPAFWVWETAIGTLENYSWGVVVKMEKVLITGKSGDAFTITRWYDGSTAQSFSSDDYFSLYPVAKVIEDIQDEVTRLETDKLDISDFIAGADLFATSATGNDSYVATMPKITSLAQIDGQVIRVKVDVANTATATLNLNGFWAKTIYKFGATVLDTNDVKAWQIMVLIWDNTQDAFELKDAIDQASAITTGQFVETPPYYLGQDGVAGESFFIEKMPSFPYATSQTDNSGGNNFGGRNSTAEIWVRFLAKKDIKLKQFTSTNGTVPSPTRWFIRDDSNNLIASGTMSGVGATVNVESLNITFANGTYFKINTDNNGASYNYDRHNTSTATNVNFVSDNSGGIELNISQLQTYTETPSWWMNVGDGASNTRQHCQIFGSGVSMSDITLWLSKISTPTQNLLVEIQTDNGSGRPTGTLAHANAVATVTPGTITADNKYTVAFAGSFTLSLGTKYHIVLRQTADTTSGTLYYRWAYLAQNTSTRITGRWGGASWGTTGVTDQFYLVTSVGILANLLAKTDADYSYKLPIDRVRILSENKSAGLQASFVVNGISTFHAGLSDNVDMWLSGTEGALSSSKGTNAYKVGRSINATSLYIDEQNLAITTITPITSPFTSQNATGRAWVVHITGGTVSLIEYSRNNSTFYTIATATNNQVELQPLDYVRITYSVAPTITLFNK